MHSLSFKNLVIYFLIVTFILISVTGCSKNDKFNLKIVILLEKRKKRCYNIYEVNFLSRNSLWGFLKK